MKAAGLVIHPEAARLLDDFIGSPTHAMLLTGTRGTGKTHLARHIAAALLAIDLAGSNNPYYQELTPVKDVITIEQVRGLIRFFQLVVPGKARVKRVAVVQDADTMGIEAQNALLKLLEEPPEGSVLLLTSSHPQRLLPTIRSRAQHIVLPNPPAELLEAHFTAQGHAVEALRSVTLRYGGDIAAIQTALSGGTDDASALALVKQALGTTSYERLLLVDGLAKQKQATVDFTDTLAAVALASLEAAAGKGAQTIARWHGVLEAAHTAQAALARNGNAKLVLIELMLAL